MRDAQVALVKQPDKTALITAINTANGYNNLNPNNPVDKALQDKLAAATAVNTNGDATPEQVKTASDDLNNALVAKKAQDDQLAKDATAKQAALDSLNTELNKVKALDKASYTPNTVTPLTEKQAAAQAIADAPNAKTTEEINAAIKALQDAQAALVPKANKTDLQTALNTANSIGNLDVTDKEDKALQDAINAAQTVNQDDNATPQQVADATKAINDAVATKAHQDALDKLNKALQDVAKINKADYTADSVKPFDTAVEAGKTVAGNNTSTVEALDNATKAVKDAAAQLVPDKSNLDTVLNEAKALEPLTDSTTDQLLKNALNAAETVKNNPSATPEEIKTATWNLEDEINNKKAADAIDSLKSAVTKANGLNEATYTPNTFEPLKAAITAGQNIINNPASADTPATLAKAKEIEQLIGALKERADKTELGNVLDKAIAYGDLNPNDAEDKALQDAVTAGQKVDGNGNATPEEVTNAVKTINDAIAAKVRQDALDELNKAIDDAKAVNKDDYKPNTVTPFETAVTAGETAKNDATKTVEELKAATKAITDAKNALDKKANKAELNTSVTTAENLGTLDTKDTEDKAVQTALDKAKTVQADQNASQEAVNTAKTELDNAVNAKKAQDELDAIKKAALDELKAELSKVGKIDYKSYTPDSVKPLADKEVLGNAIVTIPELKTTEEIKAVTQALKNLQNTLVQRANKSELVKALEKAKTLGELVATDKEDKAVQDAVEAGNTVNNDGNATTEQVANATKAINDAIAVKERQDALDELQKAINDANTVNKADYKPNTVTPFETAVTAGETAKNDATRTVEELKAATKAITDAKNALDKKADKSGLNTSVTTAEKLGTLDTNDAEDKAVKDALDKAKTVQADQNVSQEAVNTAKTELDNALNAKKAQDTKEATEKQNALNALKAELEKAKTVDKTLYTTNSVKVLTDSATAGKTVVNNATSKTTQEIEQATKALKDAQANLVTKADKSELVKALEKAKTLGDLVSTDKEDKAVQEAVTTGQTVNEDHNATVEQVANATKAINEAITAKERQDALDVLTKAIKEANSIVKEDYKPKTVTPLEDAVKSGETVRADATKTVEELKAAAKTITDAQNKLEVKANKETLNKVVKTTDTLVLNPADKEDKSVQNALNAAKNVQADQNASQEAVNKAKTDLENAVQAKLTQDKIDQVNAEFEVLKQELKKVSSIDKYAYTPNSVEPLTKAESAGQTIVNNATGKTVEEINKATQILREAQKHLVEKADKVELDKVIDTAENTELNVTDKEDKAVKEALDKAITVQENYNATQQEVNKATSDLAKALQTKSTQDKADQEKVQAFNKALEALKTQLANSRTVVKNHFTPNSVTPFEEAQAVAQGIVNNPESATKAQVENATEILKSTQSKLVTKADKSELEKVIKTAEGLKLNVTDKEDKAVKDVLAKAVNVHENQNVTQEEVNKATSDKTKALQTKTTQDKADKIAKSDALAKLEKALDKAKAIDKSKYTKASVEKLDKAVVDGRGTVEKADNVSTQDIKATTKAVESAVNGLEKVKVSVTGKITESKSQIVQTNAKSGAKTQGKQTSKATKAGKTNAKVLPNTGQDVSSIDPQYASLMFAIGGLMMFFRKRKNEEKDHTEK
ncbi:LPXTG cell wall anchor domain-containing protein [Staphylococcus simulans]|uniref:LPXTG cell wall anchor domain-containing protein n=1 Tax=Staphylococcus simulans TaxID=1286 RepID=UPI0039998F39